MLICIERDCVKPLMR